MTNRTTSVFDEAEEIKNRLGMYIAPSRLAEMMKLAAKIQKMIVDNMVFAPSYRDCEIVLDIVQDSIRRVTEGREQR